MSYQREALEYIKEEYPQLHLFTKWEVCGHCHGEGSSSAHLGVFIPGDPNDEEYLRDPDFMDDYMSGQFDKVCRTCDGRTTVKVLDEERSDSQAVENYRSYIEQAYEVDVIQAQEMRYGC